jgi:mannose-6-phosphate isomerase-like protein (cupin superfamily)
MIDFDKIKLTELPEFKGGTGVTRANMFVDDRIKICRMIFHPGDSTAEHLHDTSSEIIYVLSGRAKCTLDGEVEFLSAGQCHYCPKGHTHSITCEGEFPLTVFAIIPEQ